MSTAHVPVMVDQVLELLEPRSGQHFADGTLGGGGHALAIAQRLSPGGRLLAVDRDPVAVERTSPLLADLPVECCAASYAALPRLLDERGWPLLDGALLDLGLSSDQLSDRERGFSFRREGPLDMRFDPTAGESASDLLQRIDERTLADLIFQYGEERFSRRIARRIVETRRRGGDWTALQLAELVRSCVPRSRGHGIDPATRTFQALRIAVNQELEHLQQALADLPERLSPGGRLAVISFHSLEDRLVKRAFREDPRWEPITRRPWTASEAECAANPRSRSAKLRVARRTPEPSRS